MSTSKPAVSGTGAFTIPHCTYNHLHLRSPTCNPRCALPASHISVISRLSDRAPLADKENERARKKAKGVLLNTP